MSRMFRVISGHGQDGPNDGNYESPTASSQAATVPEMVPFVEVGGPEGVVMSHMPAATKPAEYKPILPPPHLHQAQKARTQQPWPSAVRTPVPPLPQAAPVAKPAPAAPTQESSRYLSVTFHRMPKVGLRILETGVAPEIVTYHFPEHPISGEYSLVRDEIVRQYDEPGPKVTLFTANASHAGTTTVMVNFAVSLTKEFGSRVLLVDANLARPGIARRLGCAEGPGLCEVVGQTIPLAWALQPTPIPNIHVLSTGSPTDATEEAMANDFPKLLTQLRQWFDWVVVDTGIWGDLPSAEATCHNADGVYLVSRSSDVELPGFGTLRGEVRSTGGIVRGFISTRQ